MKMGAASLFSVPKPAVEHVKTMLGFAVRSRKAVLGFSAVLQACKKGKLHLIVMDACASPASRERILRAGQLHRISVLTSDELEIEKWVGKANCRFAGITDPEFARSMIKPPVKA